MSSDETVQLIVGWGRFKRSINRIELDWQSLHLFTKMYNCCYFLRFYQYFIPAVSLFLISD